MKRKKKPSGDGYAYTFHGSYSDKSKAQSKAKRRGGWLISRVPRGTSKRRYIVLTEQVPF